MQINTGEKLRLSTATRPAQAITRAALEAVRRLVVVMLFAFIQTCKIRTVTTFDLTFRKTFRKQFVRLENDLQEGGLHNLFCITSGEYDVLP